MLKNLIQFVIKFEIIASRFLERFKNNTTPWNEPNYINLGFMKIPTIEK